MGCCQSKIEEKEFRASLRCSQSLPDEVIITDPETKEFQEPELQEQIPEKVFKFTPLIMRNLVNYHLDILRTAPKKPLDPNLIPEYDGLEYLSSLDHSKDPLLAEKLRQADAILYVSKEFDTDFEGDGLVVKFQEYIENGKKFYAGLTDIDFGVKVPSLKLVEFLNLRARRIQWDFDVKALETSGDFMNDYTQYTRIENPKVFKKYYVERRLTKKYRNQTLILSYSIEFDPASVPKHVTRMASAGINLLTAYYIKQYRYRTVMTCVSLYENTEFAAVEEKIKVSEGKNWVNTFKKMLFKF